MEGLHRDSISITDIQYLTYVATYMFIFFIYTQVNVIFLLLSLRSLYLSRRNKVQFEKAAQANIVKYVSLAT